MTVKEAYEKYKDSVLTDTAYPGTLVYDLWQAIKSESAPLDAARVQIRLRELAEWFDDIGRSPAVSFHHFAASYLLYQIAAQLEYAMAEQRRKETAP